MKTMALNFMWVPPLLGLMMVPVMAGAGPAPDSGIFAKLLKRYVHQGVVDYQGFKNDETELDAYLDVLAVLDPDAMSREDRFAFYINAYNAWTIKLILTGYPGVRSIKDLGSWFASPWKKKICRINGKLLSLDEIEHQILRPQFKDPRVHFAINCASKGCPPLISEPYEGALLDRQLDAAARTFINDPEKNRLDGNILYVSSIFKWFSEDFNDDVLFFFQKYASEDMKKQLSERSGRIKIRYLDYDWSLNGH